MGRKPAEPPVIKFKVRPGDKARLQKFVDALHPPRTMSDWARETLWRAAGMAS